jgi:hypothetical protein
VLPGRPRRRREIAHATASRILIGPTLNSVSVTMLAAIPVELACQLCWLRAVLVAFAYVPDTGSEMISSPKLEDETWNHGPPSAPFRIVFFTIWFIGIFFAHFRALEVFS